MFDERAITVLTGQDDHGECAFAKSEKTLCKVLVDVANRALSAASKVRGVESQLHSPLATQTHAAYCHCTVMQHTGRE